MRKINKLDVLRLVLVLALVAGIGLAFGAVGRFVPTHKIVQPVYCGSCHPEQVKELSATTHLGKFTEEVETWTRTYNGNVSLGATAATKASAYTNARSISGACVMCHNYWENFKWYGVRNFDLQAYDGDIPDIGTLPTPTDIYGNAVSPYGLGSTKQYIMRVNEIKNTAVGSAGLSAEPWKAGLDVYKYVDGTGTHTRLDYVWSKISSVSPGPVAFAKVNLTTGQGSGCGGGTVEHGMCHIAASAVALAYTDQKYEVSDYNLSDPSAMITGINGEVTTPLLSKQNGNAAGRSKKGIFFTHEMAFTTAQYAAKPVKICGSCHILKLPPMQWGGEPWAISDIKAASDKANGPYLNTGDMQAVIAGNDDPFGFRPTYNGLTAVAGDDMQIEKNAKEATGAKEELANFPVAFRTPDWAHANVPCIRCHAHAGINGETVSNNPQD